VLIILDCVVLDERRCSYRRGVWVSNQAFCPLIDVPALLGDRKESNKATFVFISLIFLLEDSL